MSKSFDEICNTVLGEDVNLALWENTNADPMQAVKDLAEKHKNNPVELGKAIIAHFNPPAATTPTTPATTQPNQTAQQTTPQNGQNTVNKAATPTQPNQPQQGTQPTK